MLYYLSFLSLSLSILYFSYRRPELGRLGMLLLWILMMVFAGLRVGVGRDYIIYQEAYRSASARPNQFFEPFWIELQHLFRFLELDFHAYLMFIAGLTYALMIMGARRIGKIQWPLIILAFILIKYGYIQSWNFLRQGLSMAIIFYGMADLFVGRYWRFLSYVLLASLCHMSALALLLIYPLMWQRWPLWLLTVIFGLSLVVNLFFTSAFYQLLEAILPYRYALYVSSDIAGSIIDTGLYKYFLNFLVLALLLYAYGRRGELSSLSQISIRMVLFSVVIYNMMYFFEPGLRLMLYPILFIYPLWGEVFTRESSSLRTTIALSLVVGFAFFSYKEITDPKEPYYYYHTLFSPVDINNPKI